MIKRLRAIFSTCLLLTSLQPPAWAADPIFRHNVHAGAVSPNPGPAPAPQGAGSISYPAGLGTLASGTAVTAGEGTPSVSGMAPPVSFGISQGNLPAGLAITPSSGVISGTATLAGTYICTVQATDANGAAALATLHAVTVGSVAYNLQPTGSAGPFAAASPTLLGITLPAAFSIRSGTLPSGLAIDAATGTISGSLAAAGTYSFSVQATAGGGGTATSPSYTMTVAPAAQLT